MIRLANAKDIPSLQVLLRQVNWVHHSGRPDLFQWPAQKYTESELESLLTDSGRPVYVYELDDGQIAGYAFCIYKEIHGDNIRVDRKYLYIDDLCVDEQCRGKGIGTSLFRYVEQKAKDEHLDGLELNVWTLNTGALNFYRAMGLKPQKIEMEENFYSSDENK